MSALNLKNQLFLGKIELQHLIDFIQSGGYQDLFKKISSNFGFVLKDEEDLNFQITEGTSGNVKITAGSFAIDSDFNLVLQKNELLIPVPADSVYYAIRVSYLASNLEEGTVSVNSLGEVIGVGTDFLNTLRGQEDFPLNMLLCHPSTGVFESAGFEVLKVTNSTTAILKGSFGAGFVNYKYAVGGTFSPGYSPSLSDLKIFSYDGILVELVALAGLPEDVTDLAGVITIENKYFVPAVVRNTGAISILDTREWFRFKSSDFSYFDTLITTVISATVDKIQDIEIKLDYLQEIFNDIYIRTAGVNVPTYQIIEEGSQIKILNNNRVHFLTLSQQMLDVAGTIRSSDTPIIRGKIPIGVFPTVLFFVQEGETLRFTVVGTLGWSFDGVPAWIAAVVDGMEGVLTASENTTYVSRYGTFYVKDLIDPSITGTVTVFQSGAMQLEIVPSTLYFDKEGNRIESFGGAIITNTPVVITSSFDWAASIEEVWITPDVEEGDGNANDVVITLDENIGVYQRRGRIEVFVQYQNVPGSLVARDYIIINQEGIY